MNNTPHFADTLFINGRISTLDPNNKEVSALAIIADRFSFVGRNSEILKHQGPKTTVIDLKNRRVIPGLVDSHLHLIRGGLNYNMELRWDGVDSLATALSMLKAQAQRTPAPQWVRVVGGFCLQQFAEKRLPTLEEINAAAPDTPVFIMHLYDRALLNRAAIKVCGFTKDTPDPPGGMIAKDAKGNPTGLIIAKPNATILYSTLAKGPKLPKEYQINSTLHFIRELNRLGLTGVIDAGGGFQNYPEDYEIINQLSNDNKLNIRIAYNLFTQKPKDELADFKRWVATVKPGQGNPYYRHNGAGEMLVFSAADFEDFREPRPDMPEVMAEDLEKVIRVLAEHRWPFRLHATYNETIECALSVFEKVNQDIPFNGLHWFFDHAETITEKNIERVKKLGGGIAVQHRMAYQGEFFVERYGAHAAASSPPIQAMLKMDLPVGGGTDATRVASYNPWICLYWLVTGKTVGGLKLFPDDKCLSRDAALDLWTKSNAWFSNEENLRGQIKENQLADFAVLSDDYFTIDVEKIKDLVSVLTVVGGKIVYGDKEFASLAPVMPAAMPDWSPVKFYGGYQAAHFTDRTSIQLHKADCCLAYPHRGAMRDLHQEITRDWTLRCSCWAF